METGTAPGVALQLYTVRHDFAENPEETVRRVAEAGYTAVEVAGTGEMPAGELRQLLDRFGVRAIGVHSSLQGLESDFEREMRDARTLGIEYVTTGYLPAEERQNPEQLGERLNTIGVRRDGRTAVPGPIAGQQRSGKCQT
jgi:sugar phosphate isomerase/epimerase